jgi:hypothetical protein
MGISDVLPCMVWIIQNLKDKEKKTTDPILLSGIQAGLKKLKKYYRILCRMKAYIIATVLDPRRNGNWFYTHAFPQDCEMQKYIAKVLADVFQEWYDKLGGEQECTEEAYEHLCWPQPPPKVAGQSASANVSRNYEFHSYLASPCIKFNINIFAFWRGKLSQWPTWAAIAFAYLSIPTMSAEVERLFSRYYPKIELY